MNERIKLVKKSLILILVLIQALILVSCGGENVNYPITAFDMDLKKTTRENIKRLYDERQIEKEQEKILKDNRTDNSIEEENNSDVVENEYIAYEDNLYNNVSSEYGMNLSVTTIDSNYKYKDINKGSPYFNLKEYDGKVFEKYSELDSLGRCGKAEALLGLETMPAEGEVRGSIGMVKPTGWQTPQSKYDFIDGKFLYNRCHLIGWQLSSENSNIKNLITGTRNLNIKGMLPYENQVANYIKKTHNHVLYRVTPIFEGTNLVASRVQIEALSYEDNGAGIKINVLLENYEPGVHIDYATGKNYAEINEVTSTKDEETIFSTTNMNDI